MHLARAQTSGLLSRRMTRRQELTHRPPPHTIPLRGVFKNFNTIEEFKGTETKKALFDAVVDDTLASFDTDTPNLNPFLLVTFADLKKYVYQYWFAFPALVTKPGWEVDEQGLETVDEQVSSCLSPLPELTHRSCWRRGIWRTGCQAGAERSC